MNGSGIASGLAGMRGRLYEGAAHDPLQCSLPLTSTGSTGKPVLSKGVDPVTYQRASKQYVLDFDGNLCPVYDGCAAIEGSRIVTNLLTFSQDLTGADWGVFGTGTSKSGNIVTFGSTVDNQLHNSLGTSQKYLAPGRYYAFSLKMSAVSGSFQVELILRDGTSYAAFATKTVTLTTTPTVFCVSGAAVSSGRLSVVIRTKNPNLGSAQFHYGMLEDNSFRDYNQDLPSEHVPTTNATITQCFLYDNPMGVYADGVVSDSGVRTLLSAIKGILFEPGSTNKCTNYNVIPADSYATAVVSGAVLSIGKKYEIVTRATVDFTTKGAANNNVGTQFVLNSACTLGAGDSVKEVQFAVGTIANSLNPTAIPGLTLSGYVQTTGNLVVGATYKINSRTTLDFTTCGSANNTVGTVFTATSAGTLGAGDSVDNQSVSVSIVDDTAAHIAAGIYAVTGGKAYKLDGTLCAAGVYPAATATGVTANTNNHSLQAYAKSTGGVSKLILNSGAGSVNVSGAAYQSYKSENFIVDQTTRTMRMETVPGGTISFILNQMEEQPFATSPMIVQGGTAARAQGSLTWPVSGNQKSNDFTWYVEFSMPYVPAAGKYPNVLMSYVDGNNLTGIYVAQGVAISAQRKIAGVNTNRTASYPTTFSANQVYKVAATFSSSGGSKIFVNGVKGSLTGSSNETCPLSSTVVLDGNNFVSVRNVQVYKKPLTDVQCIAMTT